jgi:hypothetical protein
VRGGPPVRGTKLLAWQVPPTMKALVDGSLVRPNGSIVPWAQEQLWHATLQALAAVAADVNQGLVETIGVESEWVAEDTRCSVRLLLPDGIEPHFVARAIDMENVEAWVDGEDFVRVAIGPWFTTKDVDQTILAVIKVVHEFTGLLYVDPDEVHTHTHD